MQQRYYDPLIGRFYSNDPVGFTASNPMMFNRYAYANNNPYKFVDPDGLEPDFKFEMPSMLQGLPEMFGFEGAAEGNAAMETKVDMALEAVSEAISPYPSSGTIEYSVGLTLSGGASGSFSVGVLLDSHKNMGMAITAGGGGGTPDLGFGPGVTRTNANQIRDLRGFGSVTSVSAGPILRGQSRAKVVSVVTTTRASDEVWHPQALHHRLLIHGSIPNNRL